MIVVVNDANILMDLIELDLISEFFELDFEMLTTDFVLNECNNEQKKILNRFIKSKNLELKIFEPDELADLIKIKEKYPPLSIEDSSVYYTAKNTDGILLTGDRKLRTIAGNDKIIVHGIFWIFDLLLENKIIEKKYYLKKLKKLEVLNKRLPVAEFEKRFRKS